MIPPLRVAAVVLLCVCGCASAQPLPRPKEQAGQTTEQKETTQKTLAIEAELRAITQRVADIEKRTAEHETQNRNNGLWWPPVLSNWALVLVAAYAAHVAIQTLKMIARQTKANVIEARATRHAANAQLKGLELLYAPAIELSNPRVSAAGSPHTLLIVTWDVENAGGTPLFVTYIRAYARAFHGKGQPSAKWNHLEPSKGRFIGVGRSLEHQTFTPNLTAEDISRFNKNHLNVTVQIEVECRSPFAKPWPYEYHVFRRMITCGKTMQQPERRDFSEDAEEWPEPGREPCTIHYQS
jgi:hypothetical protein